MKNCVKSNGESLSELFCAACCCEGKCQVSMARGNVDEGVSVVLGRHMHSLEDEEEEEADLLRNLR